MSNSFTYFTVTLPFSSRDVLTAISNLVQTTTARWQHGSHSTQTYQGSSNEMRVSTMYHINSTQKDENKEGRSYHEKDSEKRQGQRYGGTSICPRIIQNHIMD